ncbi:hypothetical protein DJ71_21330 [Halorubrum sp. E3]|nr:hypothetical protein DJ71_21330 [Halorubrum sp. E3]
MPHLVRKVELIWLVDAFEPAKTADLREYLPIDHRSIYLRLRSLYRSGYLDQANVERANVEGYDWSLTDAGRKWLATQDVPDVETVNLHEYFAGRTDRVNPLSILEAFALEDGEWHQTKVAYDALPFTKQGVRYHLHKLNERGDLELDDQPNGHPYRWRLTDQGRDRIRNADDSGTDPDGEYIWLDA